MFKKQIRSNSNSNIKIYDLSNLWTDYNFIYFKEKIFIQPINFTIMYPLMESLKNEKLVGALVNFSSERLFLPNNRDLILQYLSNEGS